jgi:hypothetical protein
MNEWSARCIDHYLHNKHNRRTPMPSAGFEPAIAAIERLQTYALHRTTTGIGPVKEMLLSKFLSCGRSVACEGICGSSSGVLLWKLVELSDKALIRQRVTDFTEVTSA